MFEKQLSDILAANLRRFIRDLNEEQLQLSLWSGDLVLRDLQLQPDILDQVALLIFQNQKNSAEALNGEGSFLFSLGDTMEDAAAAQALLLPFTVVKGEISELVISVPWAALDSEPVSVEVRGVELVFGPLRSREADPEEEQVRLEVMKQRHLAAFERQRDAVSSVVEESRDRGTAPTAGTASSRPQGKGKSDAAEMSGAASSLGSAIASMSFFEQLVQTITRNVHVNVRDISVMYLLDYDGLHSSLATAVALWIDELFVTTTDEAFEDRFVVDLTMPVCKAVSALGVRVTVHEQRRRDLNAFECLHPAMELATSPLAAVASDVNRVRSTGAAPAPSTSSPRRFSVEASEGRRKSFAQCWAKSDILLDLDELQLNVKVVPERTEGVSTDAESAGSATRVTVPAHSSLGVTLGNVLRTRFSFGSLLALESIARSLRTGLVGAPFRGRLHLLKENHSSAVDGRCTVERPLPESDEGRRALARRRWAFAFACVRDALAHNRQGGLTLSGGVSSPDRSGVLSYASRPQTPLEAMAAFGKQRREYCGLWQRNQQVPWLPRLDVAERQQMLVLEKRMTLEQIVFVRCMAYAELSVEAEAMRQQQLFIDSVRARQAGGANTGSTKKLSSAAGGRGGGWLGWFRRNKESDNATAPTTASDDVVDVSNLPVRQPQEESRTDAAPAQAVAYNARHHFCTHLAAEWEVGQRFLQAKVALRAAAAAGASSPNASPTVRAPDVTLPSEPVTYGGDTGGERNETALDADVRGALDVPSPPPSVPRMVLHVRSRRLHVTLSPEYWSEHQANESFLSHMEQRLSIELRSMELFLDNVQEPREDRAGVSFFVASMNAWFEGAFRTPLFSSRGRALPPPQGREDFLTFKQNAARTRCTVVVSPSLFILRPAHEMLWWGTELSDFSNRLMRRLGRPSAFFFSRNTMMSTTRGPTDVTENGLGGLSSGLHDSPQSPAGKHMATPAIIDVVIHSIDFVVPLFAHDLPTPRRRPATAANGGPLPRAASGALSVPRASVTSTQLPAESLVYEDTDTDGMGSTAASSYKGKKSSSSFPHSCNDSSSLPDGDEDDDTNPDSGYNSYVDDDVNSSGVRASGTPAVVKDTTARRGSTQEADDRLSAARGSQPNSFAAGVGGVREDSFLRRAAPGEQSTRQSRGQERRSRENIPKRKRDDNDKDHHRTRERERLFLNGEACLVLSVPAVRLKTLRDEERRFPGPPSEGDEFFVTVGEQQQAMRLSCQTGSHPLAKGRKIEMVSFSIIQILMNPSEVAVGVYNGAELTIDPAAFALLNDHLFKPLELYGSSNLPHTHALLQTMDDQAALHSRIHRDSDRKTDGWHFASATELYLSDESLMTLPEGEGREYVTLLHRWWLVRRRKTRHQGFADQRSSEETRSSRFISRVTSYGEGVLPPTTEPATSVTETAPTRVECPFHAPYAAKMDVSICIEFVRVIVRNGRQEDVAEMELMVPGDIPDCTVPYREAFSAFSDGAHGVELLLRWPRTGNATASAPPFVLVSIPEAAASTAVGKPVSNIEALSVVFDPATGCQVSITDVSLFFGVEVAECVETLFGVGKTLQLAPLPLPPTDPDPVTHPHHTHPQRQLASDTEALPPSLGIFDVTLEIGTVSAQFPLSSQPDQPFRALSARTKAFVVEVRMDQAGGFALDLSGYLEEALCLNEDLVNDDVIRFTMVGPGIGMLGQPEHFSYRCHASLPAPNTSDAGVSCTVTAQGGHVCVNMPFLMRCGDAISDPLYANLLNLGKSSTFRHGLSFAARDYDGPNVEMCTVGNNGVEAASVHRTQERTPPPPPRPIAFSADVSSVEVLLATDANLPVDLHDDSTFFYLQLGHVKAVHKLVPCHDGAPPAEGMQDLRRRLSLTLDSLSYSPTSDRAPIQLPLEVTVDMDFGVLLVPKKDLSGYEYTAGDTRNDFTVFVNFEKRGTTETKSGDSRLPHTLDVVLPPSRVSALLRAVALNLIQVPANPSPTPLPRGASVQSTPRRPPSPTRRPSMAGVDSYLTHLSRPAVAAALQSGADRLAPTMETPSVAIMLTIPSLRLRLLTEDQRVFALKVTDGIQYYRAAGGQWAKCPAQNIQLRDISIEEELDATSHADSPRGRRGMSQSGDTKVSSPHPSGTQLTGQAPKTLLHVKRIGVTALVSIDSAPVRGAPNYVHVDVGIDSLVLNSHIVSWASLATLLFTQAHPILEQWPTVDSAVPPRDQRGVHARTGSGQYRERAVSTGSAPPSYPPSGAMSTADSALGPPLPPYRPFDNGIDTVNTPILHSAEVFILSEVVVSVLNTEVVLLAEAPRPHSVSPQSAKQETAAATLRVPKLVVNVSASSDGTTKTSVSVTEPLSFCIPCPRHPSSRSSPYGDRSLHATAASRTAESIENTSYDMFLWDTPSCESAARPKTLLQLNVTSRSVAPLQDAPLRRAAKVGEILSEPPVMQTPTEVSLYLGGLQVQGPLQPCLHLLSVVTGSVQRSVEEAMQLYKQVVSVSLPQPVEEGASFTPTRQALCLSAHIEKVRLTLLAESPGSSHERNRMDTTSSVGVSFTIGSVRMQSHLQQAPVLGLDSVMATVPVRNAFCWCMVLDLELTDSQVLCFEATDLTNGNGNKPVPAGSAPSSPKGSGATPIDIPDVKASVRVPLPTTTFMQVELEEQQEDTQETVRPMRDDRQTCGEGSGTAYVFPPSTVYTGGRATFTRAIHCEVGGQGGSSRIPTINANHILHAAALASAVSAVVASSEPPPGGADASLSPSDGNKAGPSPACPPPFRITTQTDVELVPGFSLRLMESRAAPLLEWQLLEPLSVNIDDKGGVQVTLHGQFEVVDRHGTVLLSYCGLHDGAQGAASSPKPALSVAVKKAPAVSRERTAITVETSGVVLHLSPALVDVSVACFYVAQRLQARLSNVKPSDAPERNSYSLSSPSSLTQPGTRGASPTDAQAPTDSPTSSTSAAHNATGQPIGCQECVEEKPSVEIHVHDVGITTGTCGLFVVRKVNLTLDAPLLQGKHSLTHPDLDFHLSVQQLVLLGGVRSRAVYAHAGPFDVHLAHASVRLGVRELTVVNRDGFFWGDVVESVLLFASYASTQYQPLLSTYPARSEPEDKRCGDGGGAQPAVHVTLARVALRLCLPHSQPQSSPFSNAGYVECTIPELSVTHKCTGKERRLVVGAQHVTVVARGLTPESGSASSDFVSSELTLVHPFPLTLTVIGTDQEQKDCPTVTACTATTVQLGPLECVLPYADSMQRCAEAVGLLTLQVTPVDRFSKALSKHAAAAAARVRRMRSRQFVLEVSQDEDGSLVSSLQDRSSNRFSGATRCADGETDVPSVSLPPRIMSPNPPPFPPITQSSFQLHTSVVAISIHKHPQATSSPLADSHVLCSVELHDFAIASHRSPDSSVASVQVARIVSAVDASVQSEFLSAEPLTDTLDRTASSRLAIYVSKEDRYTCGTREASSGATETHRVLARLPNLRFTLSPGLLHSLNDEVFARAAAGVSYAKFSAAGLYDRETGDGDQSQDGHSPCIPDDATSASPSRRPSQHTDAYVSDGTPGGPVVSDEDDGYEDIAAHVDAEALPEVGGSDRVLVISTNLRLTEDLVLGGRRGTRLHFRKVVSATRSKTDAPLASSRNVLTVKSVNHARLVLSMVELSPHGLLCAPVTVDDGLTVRVEGTPIVLEGNGQTCWSTNVSDYVDLGERSLFLAPPSLVVCPGNGAGSHSPSEGDSLKTAGNPPERSNPAAPDRLTSTTKRTVLSVFTDVELSANATVQLWSEHQTVAVLATTQAAYHCHKLITERDLYDARQDPSAVVASPSVIRTLEFVDEMGEVALQNVQLLCDSGPITAAPATLVVSVKHHKLPEEESNAGVTVVKAVMPPLRVTISTGHLKLLSDILWQLRAGSAHLEAVAKPEDLVAMAEETAMSAQAAVGEVREISVPPVSPTGRHPTTGSSTSHGSRTSDRRGTHRVSSALNELHVDRGGGRRPVRYHVRTPRHGMTTTAATQTPALEVGLTAPLVEVILTNDFYRPEVTLSVNTVSVLAKGQRDCSAVTCAATASVSFVDHPHLEPPRTLMTVAPEVTLDYVALPQRSPSSSLQGDGKSLRVTLACPDVTLTLPLLSALRAVQYDFANQRTGVFAFRNELGIPLVLGSIGTNRISPKTGTADHTPGAVFCEIPVNHTVRPDMFHYNQTRFRVIPGDEAAIAQGDYHTPAAIRRLLMKGTEVDVSCLQKGATHRFPLLESSISPGGVMDVVMRLDEAERVVSFTSAVRVYNDLCDKSMALPNGLLTPLIVSPGKSAYVPVATLKQPFSVMVDGYRSNTGIPPLLSLESMITAFLLSDDDRMLFKPKEVRRSLTYQENNGAGTSRDPVHVWQRIFWNHAYMPHTGTLVLPLLLTSDGDMQAVERTESSGSRCGHTGQVQDPAAAAPALPVSAAPRRVVNLVMKKRVARESRPRTVRLLSKYDVQLRLQPVSSLVNMTGATLHVELFNISAGLTASGAGAEESEGQRRSSATGAKALVRSGALTDGEQFDWFPSELEEAAFAPHALLEMAVGEVRLRSVGPVELSPAAAQASRVVTLMPRANVTRPGGATPLGAAASGPVAALVFEQVSESVMVVKSLAVLENCLSYPVRLSNLSSRNALIGCGSHGLLAPGARHPLFLPCGPNDRPPRPDTVVSLCVTALAGRPAAPDRITSTKPSEPIACTAPTLSALLSSEENGCEHYFVANLTHEEEVATTTVAVGASRAATRQLLRQRVISLRPAFLVHNANPTLTLVVHSTGLADRENIVVPPLQSVEVVDFGAADAALNTNKGDPELVFCYASQLPEWQYTWSPPVRLTTLATAGVPVTFKHRFHRAQATHSSPSTATSDNEASAPCSSHAERAALRLASSVRVPLRHGDSPETEWFSPLTLTPSSKGVQSVITVNLDAHPPLVIENRTPHRVQFEQKLLTAVGGTVICPTATSLMTSLSSKQQFLCGYLVNPFSDAVACWDAASLDAPAVQLNVLMKRKTRLGTRTETAVCLVDLHKAESSKHALKVADNVYAFVSHDYRQRRFYVTITEDRVLESKLVFQPRLVVHTELFIRELRLYIASAAIPHNTTSLDQTHLAKLARKHLLNVNFGISQDSTEAEILAALKSKEMDLFLVRVAGLFAEGTWNERHLLAAMAVDQIDALDCTTPHPVYPVVLHMGTRGEQVAKATPAPSVPSKSVEEPPDAAVPAVVPVKGTSPCFAIQFQARRPQVSLRQMGNFYAIRGAGPKQQSAIQRQIMLLHSDTLPASTEERPASRSSPIGSTLAEAPALPSSSFTDRVEKRRRSVGSVTSVPIATRLVTLALDEVRLSFGEATLRLHDSFLYAVRQAAEIVWEERADYQRRERRAKLEAWERQEGGRRKRERESAFGENSSPEIGEKRLESDAAPMASVPLASAQAGSALPAPNRGDVQWHGDDIHDIQADADSDPSRLHVVTIYDCYVTHLYVSRLDLGVTLTRRVDGRCNPFEGLPIGSVAIPSVDGASLAFKPLFLRDLNQRGPSLWQMLSAVLWPAYRTQVVIQGCKLIGSLEALGNPAALLGGWGRGVRSLVQGTVDWDLLGGARGFMRETGSSTLHHVSLLSRLGGRTLAALSRASTDEDWLESPEARDGSVLYGLARGVTSAVGSAVVEPVEGARVAGMRGFMAGMSKGVVGLFTKPVAGLLYTVGSAADSYAQAHRRIPPPAELHVQYLLSDRNFPPAAVTASTATTSPASSVSRHHLSPLSPREASSPSAFAPGSSSRVTESATASPPYHPRTPSASSATNSPATAAWRGATNESADFISAQTYARVLSKLSRSTTIPNQEVARKLVAEVGPHNVALHAPYEDFWRFSTPEEFYNWFPVALDAQLGRVMASYLAAAQRKEREERQRLASGAHRQLDVQGDTRLHDADTHHVPRAAAPADPATSCTTRARDAAEVERARNIKATLGIRTLFKYVTLEQVVQVCTIAEIRAHVSPEDFQEKCGLLLMQRVADTLTQFLTLSGD